MKSKHFDIVFACRARHTGDAPAWIATEIAAAARAGFSVGLHLFSERGVRRRTPLPGELSEAVRRWSAQLIDADAGIDCELLIVHVGGIAPEEILGKLDLAAFGQAVVVVHDPPAAREVARSGTAFGDARRSLPAGREE